MGFNLWELHHQMFRCRCFEEEVGALWQAGSIHGEMHSGIGEEAIAAGVVGHLREGDRLALDHRGTAPALLFGVDPVGLLREFLGRGDGLNKGWGGHMHIFDPERLVASSGIVGAAAPAAVGFALAGSILQPGSVAVGFFGEAALNQGMLMEALNLAGVWSLPVLFVCKDNNLSIFTVSEEVLGSGVVARVRGLGLPVWSVDGRQVEQVWKAAGEAIGFLRQGGGPAFLHATCVHQEAHFLGDPLLRIAENPVVEFAPRLVTFLRSLFSIRGAPPRERLRSAAHVVRVIRSIRAQKSRDLDPIERNRRQLGAEPDRLDTLEMEIRQEVRQIVETALLPVQGGGAQ